MRAWLGKSRDGKFMLTETEPVIANLRGSPMRDLYVPYGDNLGYRNICSDFINEVCPEALSLNKLESIEIEISDWSIIEVPQNGDSDLQGCVNDLGYSGNRR